MEFLFKRYFWVLNSLLLVTAGFAASRALSSYVELEVFKVPFVQESAGEGAVVEEDDVAFHRPAPLRSVDLERRKQLMTGAAPKEDEGPQEPEVARLDEEEPVEPDPAPEEPAGEIDLELMAVVTTSDVSRNLALVKVDGANTRWVGIGDDLKDGFKITGITNYYVAASQGVTELLWKKHEPKAPGTMLASGPRGAVTPRPVAPPRESPGEAPSAPATQYADGVKQVGPWEYRIDRAMLNEQLQDLAKLGREARVIPNYDKDSGTYKGFKLIGVRPNSLYRAIGIRSGDVIERINGEELSSPGKALELFTQLQTSSSITLDIMRRGQQHSISYKIE